MDTKTLDAQLRERGIKKLKAKIDVAFQQLSGQLRQSHEDATYATSEFGQPERSPYNIGQVLYGLKLEAIAYLSPFAGQAEVDEFMSEVQRLAEEVDGLREGL